MSRCFACDLLSESLQYDRPTDRHYCSVCFQPTTEVMLSLLNLEESDTDFLKYVEVETSEHLLEDLSIQQEEEEELPWD